MVSVFQDLHEFTISFHAFTERFIDTFLDLSYVQNRTGKWFVGVASVKDDATLESIIDSQSCQNQSLNKDMISNEFLTETYTFRAYTGGCYYFNKSTELWEGVGQTVYNISKDETGCGTDHLTSFGSGWFPVVNTIDFDFIFAHASFEDNLTIYMCLIITLLLYLIGMIWAFFKDRKDVKAVRM